MKNILLIIFVCAAIQVCFPQNNIVWQIGDADNSPAGMALAPDEYSRFLEYDFGWEDRCYFVDLSTPEKDWPYVLPGPKDGWGGTGPTSGIRSHTLNILFALENLKPDSEFDLIVDILDTDKKNPLLFKVLVNGFSWKFQLTKGSGAEFPNGISEKANEQNIKISIGPGLLKNGANEIQFTTLQGGWLMFDPVRLEASEKVRLVKPEKVFLRSVQPASYEIEKNEKKFQPLLIDVEHLQGLPKLIVLLDGEKIFEQTLETGRYVFEAPMPTTDSERQSEYEIKVDNNTVQKGTVKRSPQKPITPAEYVDTRIGTAHSRWMIAPGPWMPFSMVKLSPDNQNGGWQAGYDPTFESVGVFSHIHEWTMGGLGMLPTNGSLKINVGDETDPDSGYRSRIKKSSEKTPLGLYSVLLSDYGIQAELTATTRCGFQRYTFPENRPNARVMIDLQIPCEYRYVLEKVQIKKISDFRITGFSRQHSPNTWSGGVSQDYTIFFVIEFDRPIKKMGVWKNDEVNFADLLDTNHIKDAGAFVEFDHLNNNVVKVRTGISLVSIANAADNLQKEIAGPFGWDFDAVRQNQLNVWNDLLKRLSVSSNDRREKVRFYTNMYRALCSRNTWSDVDGSWVDATEKVRKMGNPENVALGCDAFWNTFWNLNQFWNLVTPEWSSRWVKSQLAMYDANGWLAKGPAGMELIPVMVAEHEIPLIVGAYQMGIRDYDVEKAFQAVYKMQTTLPEKVGGGFAGNRDLALYLEHHYVPYDKGRFSNSLEYSFDDWTVSQFAKSLNKQKEYEQFFDRGCWWKNVIDPETGFARMRKSDGTWLEDFDAFRSGANHHYVEGNAWQLTFFVPQDVPALANQIGKDHFIERLDWGFNETYKWRFNGPNDQYWDYPVMQGNQQSMHFAFLFNWVGRPWLTQKWGRSIVDRYYGYGIANAYLGDEDQGQMSAWFIMAALGLFQTDGGCRSFPIYEIGSPIFEQVKIDLGQQYGRGKSFTIKAPNTSRKNKYIQRALLNGIELKSFWFPAEDVLKGGELVLEMGPEPNKNWGIGKLPQTGE